ncbi:ABC transporter substrate-binding protein [Serpentinicella alkaliphila]|uniref:Carbohydrate ABC transporter substrate-binding protein (CUT1 family) n=1 Tax=Serpentinicella alkaliphila TaxID=1734049 RepID=A0A4V2T4U8_9FIRM|nr:extracellular solute-binding protein [Serpentinicella alkaliphila]QUH25691.1 extracellular solute-binding protein [Serpentinicella alkaliphila]TCQ06594.1 carbohydrate ABC transporter substrate-binding protein (CUT1 family) [Serpentinicella alkaliphila]
MRRKKYSAGMIILSYLLSLFIIVAPIYFYIFRPTPIDFDTKRVEPAWTGIITLWDFPRFDSKKGTNFGWIYEKISIFEKRNPGVYIDFTPLTSDKGNEKIEIAIQNGTLPDILPIGNNNSILTSNLLVPLNSYLAEGEIKSYNPAILKATTFNDKIYALPWMVNTYTLMINLEMFRGRGVEPPKDGKWTYEEFVEKLQQLTFDSRGRNKADHFGFNGAITPGYYNVWGIILSDGAEIFDNKGNYVFNDEKAISGVQKLLDLSNKFNVTPEDFGKKNPNQAWPSFYKDKNIAVFPVGTWGINAVNRLNSKGTGFDYTIASFPTGDIGEPVMMVSDIGAFGIKNQDNDIGKIKMCVEFLKFLGDNQYQAELYRLGAFPVKNNIANIYGNQAEMSKIQENLSFLKVLNPHPLAKEVDEILQNEIILGVLGKKTAEEIIREANIKINDRLRKLN